MSGQQRGDKQRADLLKLYESLSSGQTVPRGQRSPRLPKTSAGSSRPSIAVGEQLDEIERERKRLENRDFAQNTELKRRTIRLLFRFLAVETGLIFAFAFAQGAAWPADFHMEEWSFKLLVAATIAQITGMLFVAVRYLFPKNGN